MTRPVMHWWTLLFRGLAGVFLGAISFFMPDVALTALIFVFAVYCGTDGVFNLFAAWEHHSWWYTIKALVGIGAALLAFAWPGVTAFALLYLIAGWSFAAGVFELITAWRLRRVIYGEWTLAVLGVFSILFATLLLLAPGPGAIVLAVWFGAYAMVYGVFLLVAAYRIRRWIGGASHPGLRHA